MGKLTLFRTDSAPILKDSTQEASVESVIIKEVIVEKPIEVIKEVEKIIVKEIQVPVEVIKEVIVEKPVEIIKEVEKFVEKEVQVVKEIEKKVIEQVYKVPKWAYVIMALEFIFGCILWIMKN